MIKIYEIQIEDAYKGLKANLQMETVILNIFPIDGRLVLKICLRIKAWQVIRDTIIPKMKCV